LNVHDDANVDAGKGDLSIRRHEPEHQDADGRNQAHCSEESETLHLQFLLQEQPWRTVTPQQMEEPDRCSLVLIAQDVWHVLNRILAKVNRNHPNLPALKAELKRIFSTVSKKAPRLTAGSLEHLQTKIGHVAHQLSQQLDDLRNRFSVFEDRETTQQRALRDLREDFAADGVAEVIEDGLTLDQTAHHFHERQPTAITARETISAAVVRRSFLYCSTSPKQIETNGTYFLRVAPVFFHGICEYFILTLFRNAVDMSHAGMILTSSTVYHAQCSCRVTQTQNLVAANRRLWRSWQLIHPQRTCSGSP
jgi:hypothetical protein